MTAKAGHHHYLLVMAGGSGTRLWPLSTESVPKQFLDILGSGRSLIQSTVDRVIGLFFKSNIYILTNKKFFQTVIDQLGNAIDPQNIILEPTKRNTAPCLLLACLKIHKRDPKARVVVLPSDHFIQNKDLFQSDIISALEKSDIEKLITFGIDPTEPSTLYGYIETEGPEVFSKVVKFTEKPNIETANKYMKDGKHLWNSGIFVWSTKAILNEFRRHQNDMFQRLCSGLEVLNTKEENQFLDVTYQNLANISIDYAILEFSKNVFVLKAKFDWNDLGNWGSVYAKMNKDNNRNTISDGSRYRFENSSGNLVKTPDDKKVVVVGLKDYIVVDSAGGLIICPRNEEKNIRNILQNFQAGLD